ncbi:hypothetical protein [Campylobacter showae]|uniref:hypothetical protein n=1 Tax=Campylobacter showae TaxID=204 RepID=UPI001E402078|nr:hypothetical protein [Campylobacter showae]
MVKICEQPKSVPDFRVFYDENATSEQIDAGLDQILDFLRQNPHRVNDELGEYCDRLFTPFIFNAKIYNTGKIDFERIEKALEFKPDLNYKTVVASPICNSALLLTPLPSGQKSNLSEADIIRLVKLLVRHGADANDKFVLSCIYGVDGFGIFKELLSMNADMREIALQIAVNMRSFTYENGATLKFGEAVNLKAAQFGKSVKFREFYREKMRYFEEFLKIKSLKELNKGGLRFFIETNLALDNAEAVKFLLENGLCERAGECEFLRKKAKFYEATEVLKLKF